MPRKKATKKTAKKATRAKKPVTKRTRARKAPAKKSELITFGLLQHEIDDIFEEHHKKQTDGQLEQTISQELAKLWPQDSVKSTKGKDKKTDIVIKSESKRSAHSPFVLDLSEMIEKKRHAEEKKHLVRSFLTESTGTFKLDPQEDELTIITTDKPKKVLVHKQFTRKPWHCNFNLPLYWHRSIVIYLCLCLALVAPIKVFSYYSNLQETKDEVVSYANSAYEDLKIATDAISDEDYLLAEDRFEQAETSFTEAAKQINNIDDKIKKIINVLPTNGANLADAEYMLSVGEMVSGLGQQVVDLTEKFKQAEDIALTDRVSLLQTDLKIIIPQLNELQNTLNKIRPQAIPEDKLESFNKVKSYFSIMLADLNELSSFSNTLNEILGKDYKKRYLFIFQNNNEIRPTGGFMGSLALIDINEGAITDIEIPGGGPYEFQGPMSVRQISPEPLHIINSLWEFQDANWFPDFPASAEKIMWFYEKAGGPTVDGVIAMNASIMPKLLETIGPVPMPAYGKVMTAENFIEETQKAVEFEYDKVENRPKQIIADLAPIILDQIFQAEGDDLLALANTFKVALEEKEIQMYFTNEAVQEKITSYDWAGNIKDSSRDYLAIINANIGGYKTDAYIEQEYSLVSEIKDSGEIINTLTIERTHTGELGSTFGAKSNLDFMRIYTPLGSQLISASGFSDVPSTAYEPVEEHWQADETLLKIQGNVWVEPITKTQINNEFNKTVFGNWVQVDPGETETLVVQYKLPFKVTFASSEKWFNVFSRKEASTFHSLYVQKQSGTENTNYNIAIKLPAGTDLGWKYPETLLKDTSGLTLNESSKLDQLIAFVTN